MNKLGKTFNISRLMYLRKIPMLPKVIRLFNRVVFACDIPYKAEIHSTVQFSHNGLGVVVNENTVIGKDSKVLQNVTIGGNMGKKKEIDGKITSAPSIGENVLIGAGAQILGPVKIGNNAKIGAGSVVTIDVPENSVAVGVPARLLEK